jgi:transcriptional regulator with XRE-family HTH domain
VKQTASRVIQDVGRRVAELRAARGWTQEKFAEELRLSVQRVRMIETGRANLTLRTLVALSNKLGVTAADLLARPASRTVRPGRPPAQARRS